jgi:putative addiction module CopG family antidote
MRANPSFNITLTGDVAELVERKLQSGAYASADEVVSEGVRALAERDDGIEKWLREEVIAGHAEYLADPSKGVAADAILDRIRSRREAEKAR